MCNPRRVHVTATRELNRAWQREVARTVRLSGRARGEARVRQDLGQTLAVPVQRALEVALAADDSGWEEVDEGYRRDVEGGYVLYRIDERVLEMVAVAETDIEAVGHASDLLAGRLQTTLEESAEVITYDDGWDGRTEEWGQDEAAVQAERRLDASEQQAVLEAEEEAEAEAAPRVEDQAQRNGAARLAESMKAEQPVLDEQARRQLETVGLRCRQAFNQVLSHAYREAILAYARRNGAERVSCNESGDTLDIEFHIHR